MLLVISGIVVFLLAARSSGGGGGGIFDALGLSPAPGGADGSPQAQAAAATGTPAVAGTMNGPSGGHGPNTANKVESAIGGVGAAAVCSYYGAAAAAPICAKIGSKVAPYAVALGNFTTAKTLNYAGRITGATVDVPVKAVNVATGVANKVAGFGDRTYARATSVGGPVGTIAKVSLAPVKLGLDLGAKGAQAGQKVASGIAGGVKSAANATESAGKKVLGWINPF